MNLFNNISEVLTRQEQAIEAIALHSLRSTVGSESIPESYMRNAAADCAHRVNSRLLIYLSADVDIPFGVALCPPEVSQTQLNRILIDAERMSRSFMGIQRAFKWAPDAP